MKVIQLFSLIVALFALTNCKKETTPTPTEFYGESIVFGNGTAKSYYRTTDAGVPAELGVAISESAMSSLPHSTNSTPIKLPTEADGKTPFTFILFDYNHLGHEPAKIYDVPHFDVHFYMTSNDDRLKINTSDKDVDKAPVDGYLPMPSVPAGVVPQMGNHWVDVTSPELNGGKFTNTLIYGSAYGKVTFVEPMISSDFAKSTTNGKFAVRQPQKYEKAGYYPAEYSVKYNATAKQYEIAIQTFVMK